MQTGLRFTIKETYLSYGLSMDMALFIVECKSTHIGHVPGVLSCAVPVTCGMGHPWW